MDKCRTGLPSPAALHTSKLHHTKLLTKLLRNEFQPNFCNYQHSEAKAVARELDFYVGITTCDGSVSIGLLDLKVILSGI